MPSKTATVGSSVGLHAHAAEVVAGAARSCGCPVTIGLLGGDAVDAASCSYIMTLGAEPGATVVVASEDEAAVEQICALVGRELAHA